MNRQQRRALKTSQNKYAKTLPDELTPIDESEFPAGIPVPNQAWLSRHFMALLYREKSAAYPGLIRLSVCRSSIAANGRQRDNISWDELQIIKAQVGLGEQYAVEVYPPDSRVVNAANFRHLWVMAVPLPLGW